MPNQMVRPVWTPAEYHEVFERAATVRAGDAAALPPVELGRADGVS